MTVTAVYFDPSRRSWVVEYGGTDRQEHFGSEHKAKQWARLHGWRDPAADSPPAAAWADFRDGDRVRLTLADVEGIWDAEAGRVYTDPGGLVCIDVMRRVQSAVVLERGSSD